MRDRPIRPLTLSLHSEVSSNLLECNFNPPTKHEPLDHLDWVNRGLGAQQRLCLQLPEWVSDEYCPAIPAHGLRTRSNPTVRSDGTPASEGPASAHAQRTPQPPRYALEPDIARMVRQRYPDGGTQLSHRALVSHWQAACVHSMGSRSRPTGTVELSGAAMRRSCGRADPDRRMVHSALAA